MFRQGPKNYMVSISLFYFIFSVFSSEVVLIALEIPSFDFLFLISCGQLYRRYKNLHVYAYGPLPCVDSVVANACSEFVTR